MGEVGNAISSAGSWFMDDVLGINPDTKQDFNVNLDQVPGGAPQPAAAAAPAAPQMAPAPVPEPMAPAVPTVQNIINTGSSGMDAAKAEAAKTPAAPPPPAFGSAPGRTATGRGKSPGSPSTFLGSSALPQRRAAAGGFGFDKQSSGSKTLIGT